MGAYLKRILQLLFVAVVCAAGPVPALAQPASSLSGRVLDSQGAAIPGASIVAVHLPTGVTRETTSGADGRFTVPALRSGGPYRITVTMAGFAQQERRDVTVTAEGTQLDFELGLASVQELVTVVAGAALARDEKRGAPNIVDIVAADSVGRFPDANAAEALRRIPGVSLEIDQGEGRFVVVRGMDASLNNVTINGQIVGTPAEFGTRGVSMDAVPADLISRLQVVKAVTPDMDANAIGASINIETLSAFDIPGGFQFGSLRSGYNNMSDRAPFTGSVSFGRVLGARRQWGVVLGASYSRRPYTSELFRVSDVTWANVNNLFVPTNHAFFLYDLNRRRQGVNASVEHRPSPRHRFAFRVNHNQFKDTEGRQQTELDLTRGTLTNQTATSGQFSQGRATREFRDYTQEHLINAAMIGATHERGLTIVDWRVGASRGERDTPNRVDWEFRSAANAFPNRYDVSNPEVVTVTPSANFYDAAAYPFRRVRFRQDIEREDVWTGEVNVRQNATLRSRQGYWKAGAKLVTRDKMQDRSNQNYTLAGAAFSLAEPGLGGEGPSDFFRGNFRFGPTLNLPALQRFFTDNPQRFQFDSVTSAQNSVEQDFRAKESVVAAYGMMGLDFRGGNVLGGVRVETTRGSYSAGELVFASGAFTGRVNELLGEAEYTHALPGVHVNFFPSSRVTIRTAWTNTIGRPAYADLAPISILDEVQETDGSFIGSLSTGNAELQPYESMNFDLSVEMYFANGLASVAPFYKRIDNPIYDRSIIEQNRSHNGRTYARFGLVRPENAERGHVGGVEMNYQTRFTALPAPLDGLGTALNYTWTDSSVTIFGRDDQLPFFKQSDHIGNAALLYQKHGIEAQLSVSFQGPALGSVGTTADVDNYSDWYRPVDAKVSVPLGRILRCVVELRNITDEARRRYAGTRDRLTAYELYSRDFYAGLDWRF